MKKNPIRPTPYLNLMGRYLRTNKRCEIFRTIEALFFRTIIFFCSIYQPILYFFWEHFSFLNFSFSLHIIQSRDRIQITIKTKNYFSQFELTQSGKMKVSLILLAALVMVGTAQAVSFYDIVMEEWESWKLFHREYLILIVT